MMSKLIKICRPVANMRKQHFLVMIFLFSNYCFAKCAPKTYGFKGVTTSPNGELLENVKVDVEWQDSIGSQINSDISDAKGSYKVSIDFNAYSGHGGPYQPEDMCENILRNIKVTYSSSSFGRTVKNLTLVNEEMTENFSFHNKN